MQSERIGRYSPVMRRFRYSLVAGIFSATISGFLVLPLPAFADASATPASSVAVAPQYDSTHVYVAAADVDRFVASFVSTFGGTASDPKVLTVTPTPSKTISRIAFTPVGILSVFGFQTPIPYPFGVERTGYLVNDMDAAVQSARANGADVVVTPFDDPIGRDAVIEWPGGIHMQRYWHRSAPHYAPLASVPENRVYVSPDEADAFIRGFVNFSHGRVVSDDGKASGVEIGRPNDTYRRVRIESPFGKMTVLVTDGHLPYPYGREITGYEVASLPATLEKARTAGATILVAPYTSDGRQAAIVQFRGGYIAEIHSLIGNIRR